MSLNAYDGMVTKKGLPFIQKELLKRIHQFREMSIDKLAKQYADIIVAHVDKEYHIIDQAQYYSTNEVSVRSKIDNIKITDKTTLVSYLCNISNILSEGH